MKPDVRRPAVVVVLAVAFALVRLAAFWLAENADVYNTTIDPVSDVTIYEGWGRAVHADGEAPYGTVDIEYPPGAIPFIVAPAAVTDEVSYLTNFALLMMAVDAVGFAALVLMARRGGSVWGVIGWIVLPPLLGPLLYGRFDLVPAVALILALERSQAKGWFGVGGWLGFGTLAKLFPAFLAPLAFLVAPRRRQVIYGFGLIAALMLLPYVGVPRAMTENVLGYHGDRGVHFESLWGTVALVGDHLGIDAGLVFQFGTMEVYGDLVEPLEMVANVLAAAGVLAGAVVAWRWARRGSPADLSLVMFGTLMIITGVGRVYSPQYVVWLLGAGCAALALAERRARGPFVGLVVVTAMTAAFFPLMFDALLDKQLLPEVLLLGRNLITVGVGVWLLLLVRPRGASAVEESTEAVASPGDAEKGAEDLAVPR